MLLVLLLALCGSAIVGAIVYTTWGAAGSSRVAVDSEDIYVMTQNEIERAKAALILAMDSTDTPLRMRNVSPIDSPDDLVVYENGGAGGLFPPASVDKTITVGGVSGPLSVRILDMRYKAGDVVNDDRLIALLPPCMEDLRLTSSGGMESGGPGDPGGGGGGAADSGSVSAGVYLIRATAKVGNMTAAIETSVIQNTGL
jgi:hypothetical protein